MSSRPQQGAQHPFIGRSRQFSARLQLACGMAAGFDWREILGSRSRERFVRLESSTLERSGSLTLNNSAPTAAQRCAAPRHRPSRLDLIRFENRQTRDSQRRGLAGARAPDNQLTIYTGHCYRLKLIYTQIIVGTNRHSNGEPRPSHRRFSHQIIYQIHTLNSASSHPITLQPLNQP